jgi:hypothetical protein
VLMGISSDRSAVIVVLVSDDHELFFTLN